MYTKILVGYNGSAKSEKALTTAIEWLKRYPATELEVLFVAKVSHMVIGEAYIPSQQKTKELTYSVSESILTKARNIVNAASIKANIQMSEGQIASMITEYAEDHQCGLIIIGSSQTGLLHRWKSENKCEKIIRLSSKPVLVVK